MKKGNPVEEAWDRLVIIHNHAKSVYITAEEYDKGFNAFIQPASELKHALEHIIRSRNRPGKTHSDEYIVKSLDKAIGHEYRSFFDSADWLCMSLREKITEMLEPYTHDCIDSVIPNFYREILPQIHKTCDGISNIRKQKDILKDDDYFDELNKKDVLAEVNNYVQETKNLIEIFKKITFTVPSLCEWTRKTTVANRKKWWLTALGFAVTFLAGAYKDNIVVSINYLWKLIFS